MILRRLFLPVLSKMHANTLMGKLKTGFTLAEVIITLGIVGVVAAMTIPVLITNVRGNQYRSGFKKNVALLSQAATTSSALYGFDYSGLTVPCSNNGAKDRPENIMSICALLNGTLTGATYYANVTDIKLRNGDGYNFEPGPFTKRDSLRVITNYRGYVLKDGTIIGLHKQLSNKCFLSVGNSLIDISAGETSKCVGFIDVNGTALPNKEVSCSSGSDSIEKNDCIVKNDGVHLTDVFPIRFHDGVVEPASAAGRYVLKN